jgi:hypothetical protein
MCIPIAKCLTVRDTVDGKSVSVHSYRNNIVQVRVYDRVLESITGY